MVSIRQRVIEYISIPLISELVLVSEPELRMKILLIFTLLLISGGGETRIVMGYPGEEVLIKCRYERSYKSSWIFFCKTSGDIGTAPIRAGVRSEWIHTGRFSLFDDTRAAEFWVLMRELTVEDSGLYLCGDYEFARPVFTPVELNVEEDLSYEKSVSVAGHVGGSVNISCKYPQSHSSDPKFLCKRVGTADCSYETSVKESRRWINEGKLDLHDDGKQIFTVIINSLTEGESGEYWCGAESDWTSDHGYKVYITQINLRVTEQPASSSTSPSSSTPQSTEPTSSAVSSTSMIPTFKTSTAILVSDVITGVSVILLLLIGLLFFIVTVRRRCNTQVLEVVGEFLGGEVHHQAKGKSIAIGWTLTNLSAVDYGES
ncbi:hypothetical protein MHYP_G00103830 [Metynnis hypsauchen]